MYHRNPSDDRLLRLQRAADGGDEEAAAALVSERERAGVYDRAAAMLIEGSYGRLPPRLVHQLHQELMRYDLLRKLSIWEVTIDEGLGGCPRRVGLFGDQGRAWVGAAREAILEAEGTDLGAAHALNTITELGHLMERQDAALDPRAGGTGREILEIFNLYFAEIRVRQVLIE